MTEGVYDLPPETPIDIWYKWGEFVHGDWMYYNDDNPEPDQMEAMDGFNRLSRMTEDCSPPVQEAFKYLCRMEEAAHAAAHALEEGRFE